MLFRRASGLSARFRIVELGFIWSTVSGELRLGVRVLRITRLAVRYGDDV